jgi:hypothetical protein
MGEVEEAVGLLGALLRKYLMLVRVQRARVDL